MKKLFISLAVLLTAVCSLALGADNYTPSYIAVEVNSGRVLYSSNAEQVRPISSLSQVATALVALDWAERTGIDLNRVLTVPQEAYAITAGNPMDLHPGDRITLRDALYSTLLGADNVSALSVANYVGRDLVNQRGGGAPIAMFVREMNNLASAIGMKKTRFAMPHGLDAQGQVSQSCAVDLVLLGTYAMQRPAFAYIVGMKSRRIGVETAMNGSKFFDVKNTNALLSNPNVDGIKTGSSRLSGPCLMVSCTRNAIPRKTPSGTEKIYPQRMIIVVLGTSERYKIAQSLIPQGWQAWNRWLDSGMSMADPKNFLQLQAAQNTSRQTR
jgi:D-alanyl-D-alanine carboxypeptidase